MKKLLIVAVVALLALALVACGSETPTTTKGTTVETTPVVTTPKTETPAETTPVVGETTNTPGTTATPSVVTTAPTTPAVPGTDPITPPDTNKPVLEGIDILNGDPADMAINATWGGGMNAGAFENHHASLDMNWAYVLLFTESENAIYEELIMTTQDEEGNDIWMMNEDFKWVLTLNGEDVVIERFSIYHNVTSGYVRMDLGEDFELAPANEEGYIEYDIILRVFDVTQNDEPVYYAWLTDPEWNDIHSFVPPPPVEMVVDPNRDSTETLIPGATPFTGPTGFAGELYENLFDNGKNGEIINVQTKLCCGEDLTTPIVWKYDEAVYVTSYSLVGAGDDATYYDRVITTFKFYGSDDGVNWKLLDEQNGEAATEATNFAERNFKLTTPAEYTYFKLEPVATSTYQLSGILLWTKE